MTPDDAGIAPRGHLEWLLHATNSMVRCRDLPSLLNLAYDAIREGLGYDRVGIMLVDHEQHTLSFPVGTDRCGQKYYPGDEDTITLSGEMFFTHLLRNPRMAADGPGFIYVADAMRELPRDMRERMDGQPDQNLWVSLRTAGQIIGFISVDNLVTRRAITPDDAPPLVAFANALAIAAENIILLEQRARRIDVLDADLHRRIEQLTWLQEAGERLARQHDLDAIFDAVYACVRAGLGYDRVGLFVIERDDDGRPTVREVRGTDEHGQTTSGLPGLYLLDDADLPLHSPDLFHLTQGHASYFCADRWEATPEPYRYQLEGRMHEQLAVALRHDGVLVGFISVDNLLSGRSISPDDAAPLVAFAGQAALAIARARLWEEHQAQGRGLAQRVADLEWLREISRRVNEARELDEILDVVYDGVREGLGYDRVGINLFDRASGIFEERRGTDEHGNKIDFIDRHVTITDDSPIWRLPGMAELLRGDTFYYTPDVTAECPPDLVHLFDGRPTHNVMAPLRSGVIVTGMISVDNLISGRPISVDDAGPLLALAHQVGTAIENARLQERERAERTRLSVLLDSARALNSTLDRDQILHDLAALLITALDATSALFTDVDLEKRVTRALAHCTRSGHPPIFPTDDRCYPLDDYPILEQILQTQIPFYGHIDQPDFPESERRYLCRHGLQAELVVPVAVHGHATNTFEVYWDHPIRIGPDMVALCHAIAEQAAVALANARLYADAAERAEHDALTGLLNHRALVRYIDTAAASDAPFAFLLLDIDNFKLFNDTYGHPVGDAVLTQVSATLRDACRDGDLAGRYGGDEFALLLRGAGRAEASAIARRLNAAVRTHPHVTPDGTIIPLALSIGVACSPMDGRTRQELVAVADEAMYAAKRGGRTMRARQAADLLGDSPFGMLEGLVNAVDAKDRYTREHSEDVTHLALLLAEAMRLGDDAYRILAVAGPLHDVGKIAVPDRVLRKPGRLTADEYTLIKRHVVYGVAIVRGVLDDPAVVDAVAYHHERWDGRGYPHGLSGPQTPLVGRIMQIADAVSAMMMDRPYRQGMAWPSVVAELRAGAGSQFDPDLVEVFIAATSRVYDTTATAS